MIPLVQGPLLMGGDLIYAILDAALQIPGSTSPAILSNGGLTYTQSLNTSASAMATIARSSRPRYFEVTRDSVGHAADTTVFGVAEADGTIIVSAQNNGSLNVNGYVNDGLGMVGYGGSYADGSVFGFKLDLDTSDVTVMVNGTAVFSRTMGGYGPLIPFIKRVSSSSRAVSVETFNFGQNPWNYDPGEGWVGWARES